MLCAEPFNLKFVYTRSNEPLALTVSCPLLYENRSDLDLDVDAQVFPSSSSSLAVLSPRDSADLQASVRFRLAGSSDSEWSEPRSISAHGFSPVTIPGPAGAGSTVLVTVQPCPDAKDTTLVLVEPLFVVCNASSAPLELDQPASAGPRAQPRTVAPGAAVGVHFAPGAEEPLVRVRVPQHRWSEPFSLQAQHAQYLRLRADDAARPDAYCLLTLRAGLMQTVWTVHGDDGSAPFLLRNRTSVPLEYAQEGSSSDPVDDVEHLPPHCEVHFGLRHPTGPQRLVLLGHAVDITRPNRVACFRHGARVLSCVTEPRRACWVVTVRECADAAIAASLAADEVRVVHEPPLCVRAMGVYAAQASRVEVVVRVRDLGAALVHSAAREQFALRVRDVEARVGLSSTAACVSLAVADLAVKHSPGGNDDNDDAAAQDPLLAPWRGAPAAAGEDVVNGAPAVLRMDACVLHRTATAGVLVLPRVEAALGPLELRVHARALDGALTIAEDVVPLLTALPRDQHPSSNRSSRRGARAMEPVHVGELVVAPVVLRVCFTPYTVGALLARHRSAVQLAARLVGAIPGGVITLAPRDLAHAELAGGLPAVLAHLRRQCLWPLVQQTLAVLTDGKLSWVVARLARVLLPSGDESE